MTIIHFQPIGAPCCVVCGRDPNVSPTQPYCINIKTYLREPRRCVLPRYAKSSAPTKPGFYYAKWRICDDGTADEQHFEPHDNIEIVEVFCDDNRDPEEGKWRAFVPGVALSQNAENFVWFGPVLMPIEEKG